MVAEFIDEFEGGDPEQDAQQGTAEHVGGEMNADVQAGKSD